MSEVGTAFDFAEVYKYIHELRGTRDRIEYWRPDTEKLRSMLTAHMFMTDISMRMKCVSRPSSQLIILRDWKW